jgi:hypothetical protein
MLLGFYT